MTYQPQRFNAPDGSELVVLAAADYDRLRSLAEDGEDVASALAAEARIAAGERTVPGEVVRMMVDGRSAVGAWRRYRKLSQAGLAARAGLSQAWIGRIEAGGGHGTVETRRKLATALDAPLWSIEDDASVPKAASPNKGRKYRPLTAYLRACGEPVLTIGFETIADLVGSLPASASIHREWWANHHGNSQARGWMDAGYDAQPDIKRRQVTFKAKRS